MNDGGDTSAGDGSFGIARPTLDALRRVFNNTPGVAAVWLFGSRARGTARPESDIDMAVDAPGFDGAAFEALHRRLHELPTLYKLDAVHWQAVQEPVFRSEIEQARRVLWQPARHAATAVAAGGVTLKRFQSEALATLQHYLHELRRCRTQSQQAAGVLRAMEGQETAARQAADFPANAWQQLRKQGRLPRAYAGRAHSSRWDGAGNPIPNICLKVPTGGGKTLLAAAAVGAALGGYLRQHTGLVLWVVPNDAIYRQTLKALSDRDHPYRQLLNVAGAGRVKLLDKNSPLTRMDVEGQLCVMLLMLQSAARQSRETLRFFRDRGNVLGFLPGEDDIEAHWALLQQVPNLSCYAASGLSDEEARAQKGSIVKSSLGNVMRLVRPIVVIDEGHHAYSETALQTIDGLNPSFMLELSATPRLAAPSGKRGNNASGSNILVDVRGTDLDEAEMIKLPIHVDVRPWQDWQSCLAAAVAQLDELQREAELLHADTARRIRPILLVQVERTGADLLDSGHIHAEHARAYLLQLGLTAPQIAVKTSERDELKAPENIDLLAAGCEVRAIITKQALQEGWDCPFAYVLCALAASRNLGAMTQLVGRILRLPQTAKTGRAALDACYVLCHDARTGDVVKTIRKSLQEEGMGDLDALVVSKGSGPADAAQVVRMERRPPLRALRLFVPTVAWVEAGAGRRPLDYDSDVLAAVPWQDLRVEGLALDWAPDVGTPAAQRFTLGLDILQQRGLPAAAPDGGTADSRTLERTRIVRALLDLTPNAWLAWDWVTATVARLLRHYDEAVLARSAASLIERLRVDIEAERDRLAEVQFERLLAEGHIEFRLRADTVDYELPHEMSVLVSGQPPWLQRADDGHPVERSLLQPALRLADMNELEWRVAGYLDQQAAVRWWHRNVARSQAGLQGWKRHKVYPDFVFAVGDAAGQPRIVLLETKGAHLQGDDTQYKQRLLARLTAAFSDERGQRIGSLELEGGSAETVVCDLVFDDAWRGALAARYFNRVGAS